MCLQIRLKVDFTYYNGAHTYMLPQSIVVPSFPRVALTLQVILELEGAIHMLSPSSI